MAKFRTEHLRKKHKELADTSSNFFDLNSLRYYLLQYAVDHHITCLDYLGGLDKLTNLSFIIPFLSHEEIDPNIKAFRYFRNLSIDNWSLIYEPLIDEIDLAREQTDAANTLIFLGAFLHEGGWYELSHRAFSKVFKAYECKELDDFDPTALLTWLSSSLDAQGDSERALELSTLALEFNVKNFGSDSAEVIASKNSVALILCDLGRYSEAERYIDEALLSETTIGAEDATTSLNNKGVVFSFQQRYPESYDLSRDVLKRRLEGNGSTQLDIAYAYYNYGICASNVGEYEIAEIAQSTGLGIREELLGPDHLKVSEIKNDLAKTYYALENYEKSQELLIEVLESREKKLGRGHPDYLNSFSFLARIYSKIGRDSDALEVNRTVFSLFRKSLGDEHPEVWKTAGNLASTLFDAGELIESRALYQEAITRLSSLVGPNEGLCLTAKFNFAESLDNSGSKEQAIVLYLQVLEGLVDKYPERIDVINRLKQTLGVTYREVGRPGDGVGFLEEVYESESRQGDVHNSSSALVAIATNYRDMGQLQNAIEITLKAVELLEAEELEHTRDDLIFTYERLKSIYELSNDIALIERCDSIIFGLSNN